MASYIVPMLVMTVISLLASYLMRPKMDNPIQDSTPSTIASRGAFIPLLQGIRRLGPVVAWVGNHQTVKEGGGGKGSGGGGGETIKHKEKAMHILCVGPAYALHKVIVSGRTIWEGPVTRDDTPSGSTIKTGKGRFQIYWGEEGQPVDPTLQLAWNLDISSKWENLCYVVWNSKALGASRVWPLIDYVVEVRPEYSLLEDTPAWNVDTVEVGGDNKAKDIWSLYGPGGPDGSNYIIMRNRRPNFYAGRQVWMKDNGTNPDGEYTILSNVWKKGQNKTFIYLAETLTDDIRTFSDPSYQPTGTLTPYVAAQVDGCNPAHMIYQFLFATYPHGLGYSVDDFNMDSLEDLGVLLGPDNENYLGSFLAEGGEECLGSVASIMQDIGAFLRWNTRTGLWEFVSIREPVTTPIHLDEDSLAAPLPRIETVHGERQRSRMLFAFKDRTKNFRPMTVSRDNDALASSRGHMKTISINVPSTVNFVTAVAVSERRSQEEFGNFSVINIEGNKECRGLLPGEIITVAGIDQILRVLEIKINTLQSRIELGCAIDFYGISLSSFEDAESGGDPTADESPGQAPFLLVEVPAFLKSAANFDCIAPYIRESAEVTAGLVHISRDDVTYQQVHSEQGLQSGGELLEAIAIDDSTYMTTGPEFEVIGPDIAEILDLTGDDENWRLGRQLMMVNGEIFYCKNVTAISDGIYRADGLIRARYDTVKEAHAIGDNVFIFDQRNIEWFDDLLLIPDKTLYVKVQPEGTDQIELDELGATQYSLHGKGLKPMDVRNLRTEDMRQVFFTGGDVDLKWTYMSAIYLNACAGLQGAGEPHSKPPVPGEFIIRLRTIGDVDVAQITKVLVAEHTIANADLVTWFSGEPSSFKVAVSLVNSGYESRETEITITRI